MISLIAFMHLLSTRSPLATADTENFERAWEAFGRDRTVENRNRRRVSQMHGRILFRCRSRFAGMEETPEGFCK
jgi:hypothetical protein